MRLVLLGPPGAGKGTQAKMLSNELSLPHVASGDLLRQNIETESPLGLEAKGFMDKGELVPDELVIDMMLKRIESQDCTLGYILDGFPRTLQQADVLDVSLNRDGKSPIEKVIYMRVSQSHLLRRLGGRIICRGCESPYHIDNSPPKEEGKCDLCGQELYRRDDDSPQAIEERIKVYMKQTLPLVQYYDSKSKLVEVNAEGNIDSVAVQLKQAVKA